jgi:hypothetical protein
VSDPDFVVPDALEPLELWRTWSYDGERLCSHNGTAWKPGQALEAGCLRTDHRAEAAKVEDLARCVARQWPAGSRERVLLSDQELQDELATVFSQALRHTTPEVDCTCGIYALDNARSCPAGVVYGKVALWGKVVRGDLGARAQFGYPTALFVPDHLLGDEALREYMVPLKPLGTPGGPYSEGGAAAGAREPRRPIAPSPPAMAKAALAA